MVVILAALFAGLSVTAAAENDISSDTISGYVVAYTLAKDDTVLKVCNKLGIDFYKNQALITKINNIADYSKLPVGKVVWLPATSVGSAKDYYTLKSHKVVSGDNVNTLLTKYGIASTDTMLSRVNNNLASPTVGSTLTFPVYTGDSTAKMADTTAAAIGGTAAAAATGISTTTGATAVTSGNVAYYLMAYTMKQGDTVGAVCTANGISFNQNSALISRINGITNYNRIPVGRTIMIPTGTATGATYSVVAHQIQAGETANSICATYGTSLANNLTLVKGLNNTNNLNYIQAGGILYVPVLGASGGGSGGGGGEGGSGGGGGDVTPGSVGTYKLSKDDCDNGSFVLKVDGAEATTAVEGKTVTIVCSGKNGFVQKTVVAHMTGDTTKVVKVTNNTFTMPDYNVTVSVTFGKATVYKLTCNPGDPAGSGAYELSVDDKVVTTETYGGAVVTVKPKPEANFMPESIKVTYKDSKGKVQEVTVTDNRFTMPNADATIDVKFKPSAGYEYPLNSVSTPVGGKFHFEAGTNVVSKTKSGMRVWIKNTPEKGYKLDTVTIKYYVWNAKTELPEIKTVKVSDAQFIMPTFDDEIELAKRYVDVEVKFIESKTYSITLKADSAGTKNTLDLHIDTVDGKTVTKQSEPGRHIVLVPNIKESGYELDKVTVTYGSTTIVLDSSNFWKTASFDMPHDNVTITPAYKSAIVHTVTFTADPSGMGKADFTVNAGTFPVNTANAKIGDIVHMTITPDKSVQLKKLTATYQHDGKTVEIPVKTNNFTMPAAKVTVTGEFEYVRHQITTTAPNATVEYYVNSEKVTDGRAAAGSNVVMDITMKDKYELDEVIVTYKDSKSVEHEVTVTGNKFVMPEYDVTVNVVSKDGAAFAITVNATNGTAVVKNGKTTVTRANNSDSLTVEYEPATYYEFDKISVIDAKGNPVSVSGNTFTMPECDVTVNVTFKGMKFALSKIDTSGVGEIKITDGNKKEISEARYGDTVEVIATADSGYKLVSVGARNATTKVEYVNTSVFTMPAFNVEVTAEFAKLKENLSLSVKASGDGTYKSLSLQIDEVDKEKATEGDTVTISAIPGDGCSVDATGITVVTASGKSVAVSGYSFIMPDESVTVTVPFKVG